MSITAPQLRYLFCSIFLLLATDTVAAQTATASRSGQSTASFTVTARVDQRVELMSIVARLAEYPEYVNDQFKSYAAEVDSYFAKYKQHPAVAYAIKVRNERGVSFDAVMSIAVHMEPPPKLTPRVAFTDKIPDDRWSREGSELTRLEAAHINFSDVPTFYPVNGRDVEIPPNLLLVVKSKNRKPRIVPMNPLVRAALSEAMQAAVGSELVFSIERNGVSYNAIRRGFETACDNAGISYGQTKPGGITWHDLRHTFATRLRGQGVHEFDIMHLMGHSSVGVTAGYAHATPSVIQSAVNKLAEPRGEVVQFARRAG